MARYLPHVGMGLILLAAPMSVVVAILDLQGLWRVGSLASLLLGIVILSWRPGKRTGDGEWHTDPHTGSRGDNGFDGGSGADGGAGD